MPSFLFIISWFLCGIIAAILYARLLMSYKEEITLLEGFTIIVNILTGPMALMAAVLFTSDNVVIWRRKSRH